MGGVSCFGGLGDQLCIVLALMEEVSDDHILLFDMVQKQIIAHQCSPISEQGELGHTRKRMAHDARRYKVHRVVQAIKQLLRSA